MKKMKKQNLFFLSILCIFVFFLPSCIDHKYDLTDENLDKNVVFSPDGIDIPIGNIDTIYIGNELKELFDNEDGRLQTGPDGVFYIEYSREFPPIEFPEYEVPRFGKQSTDPVDINLPGQFEGKATLPPSTIPIVPEFKTGYEVTRPVFSGGKGIEIALKKVQFVKDSYRLNVTINLSGIRFLGETAGANLILSLQFPSDFVFENKSGINKLANGETKIELTAPLGGFSNGAYTLPDVAALSSYTYNDNDNDSLTYSVQLIVPSPLSVEITGEPKYSMDFSVSNDDVRIDNIKASVKGTESQSGEIDITKFTDVFHGNVLAFKNPSLLLTLQSNLQTGFNLDMNMSAHDTDGEIGKAAIEDLNFAKPTSNQVEETSYLLSPSRVDIPEWREFKLNNLFRGVPQTMNYSFDAKFADDDVTLLPGGQVLSAAYTIKLPFDFEELNLEISNTITDLFSEDMYSSFFEYAKGNVKIQADNVAISLGNEMELSVIVEILDGNYEEIGIEKQEIKLNSGPTNTGFAVEIKHDDMAKMGNARHLKFAFKLSGEGPIVDTNYPNSAYIHIQKVRIVSDGGIHFEVEL
jgi:hypothetical protein